jgi:excisionase family DNA binding protein
MPLVIPEPVAPTAEQSHEAGESARVLASRLHGEKPLQIQIVEDDQAGATIAIPAPAARLLADILTQMAQGNALTLIPSHAELTTQQAADFLNVSRPFLVGLLDRGVIAFRRVGTHRRVRAADLLEYRQHSDAQQRAALYQLLADAQEQDLGY